MLCGGLGVLYVTARTWHDLLRSSLQDRGIRAKQSRIYYKAIFVGLDCFVCYQTRSNDFDSFTLGLLRSARNDEERPDWIASVAGHLAMTYGVEMDHHAGARDDVRGDRELLRPRSAVL